MEEHFVKNWLEFDSQIQALYSLRLEVAALKQRRFNEPLFRGVGNGTWGLQTTLERSFPLERSDSTLSLRQYYYKATGALSIIETFTGRSWDKVPRYDKFCKLLDADQTMWLDIFLTQHPEIYEYFMYLRHHGFPSPLLDWTASPYIAVFFAFDNMDKDAEHVAVYGLLRDTSTSGSGHQHFFTVGAYAHVHSRHYSQQSHYSMCVKHEIGQQERDYSFCPHDDATAAATGLDGKFVKYYIPASERLSTLRHLDLMNINQFSLFGSDDALVRTIARRECLFNDWRV